MLRHHVVGASSNSATSRAAFALSAGLLIATSIPFIRRNTWSVHAIVLLAVMVGADVMLLGGGSGFVHALGRKSDLTGRTEIWEQVIRNGSERGPRCRIRELLAWSAPGTDSCRKSWKSAQRSAQWTIEVYLNLGLVGLAFIALLLFTGYRQAARVFRNVDPAFGALLLAYISAGAIYCITEAGFRILTPQLDFHGLRVHSRVKPCYGGGHSTQPGHCFTSIRRFTRSYANSLT